MKKLLLNAFLPAMLLSAHALFSQNYNVQLRSTVDFPGQTLANVCGYAQDGHEYALVGASQGMAIVEITNPDLPQLIVQIPGPDNLWKEIKTYKHFAYVTSEGGQGLQVVDLSQLPSPDVSSYFYTGDGVIEGQLNKIHALHIDTTQGYLYAYGGELYAGGAKVFDLNPDPYHPEFVGKFDQLNYVHDGYADNDTLYACHINDGYLSIVDMHDKANPQLLGTIETPARFTHNSWLLSDHKHILTTDEKLPSFVTAYDISDPSDIQELDRIATTPEGNTSIGHNTHVLNDWAITSWYVDGLTLVDAHRPTNLIQVGRYDTYAGEGLFDGCWGVYPFFPSGNIIASNIPNIANNITGKLFVLTPTYLRACYLEGNVKNTCTGLGLKGASVVINSLDPLAFTETGNNGDYKTGQPTPGAFTVIVSKEGYISQTFNLTLTAGEVTELNVNLEPVTAFTVTGTVVDAETGQALPNVPVVLSSTLETYNRQTDAAGQFNVSCAPGTTYNVTAAAWGYLPSEYILQGNGPVTIALEHGYYDDFQFNLNWTATATSPTGQWVRGNPVGTTNVNSQSNPENDADQDGNELCYITGNAGAGAGTDDVDGGSVTLNTPVMQLAAYDEAKLSFWYWFYNGGGTSTPNDHFRVFVSNGLEEVQIFADSSAASVWNFSNEILLSNFITLNDNVQVHFVADDTDPGHVVEAGVDIFKVVPFNIVGSEEVNKLNAFVQVVPNPTSSEFAIRYDWTGEKEAILEVRNALGQLLLTRHLDSASGTVQCGAAWPTGLYTASLQSAGRRSVPVKMVKQ